MIPEYAHSAASTDYAVFIDGDVFTVTATWPGVVCPWGGRCHELVNVNGAHLGYCGSCGAATPDATVETLERTYHGREILAERVAPSTYRCYVGSLFHGRPITSVDVTATGHMFAKYCVSLLPGQYVYEVVKIPS